MSGEDSNSFRWVFAEVKRERMSVSESILSCPGGKLHYTIHFVQDGIWVTVFS